MLLTDKVCIITGAASQRGIGRATARLFSQHGGRVVIVDLDEAQARAAAADLGEGHLGFACNVTDRQSCQDAAERVIGEYGRVDVLVNNAGITQPLKIMDIDEAENYDAHPRRQPARHALPEPGRHSADARAALRAPSSACPRCRRSAAAASSAVRTTRAAKAGVLGLAKAMARELGPDSIRVNCVTPGLIQTDITGGKLTDEMQGRTSPKGIPLSRLGVADDVAGAYLFLASDLSAYITGAVIDVNGGMLIH